MNKTCEVCGDNIIDSDRYKYCSDRCMNKSSLNSRTKRVFDNHGLEYVEPTVREVQQLAIELAYYISYHGVRKSAPLIRSFYSENETLAKAVIDLTSINQNKKEYLKDQCTID